MSDRTPRNGRDAAAVVERYRPHEWINTNTLKPIYSIQARVGRKGWAHLHDGGKPMFYETARERDEVLRKLNAEDHPNV